VNSLTLRPTADRGAVPLAIALASALLASLLVHAGPVRAGEQLGSVTVNKVDELGAPLGGACFALVGDEIVIEGVDEEVVLCDDDEDGTLVFVEVSYGDYTLYEVLPPEGYVPADDGITPVSVNANAPNPVVTIENLFVGPGGAFLFVNKLNCTGADEAYLDVTVFGVKEPGEIPDPDLGELGLCGPGRATFRITGGALAEPMIITTGALGFAQGTLDAGDYVIEEIEPENPAPVAFTVADGEFVDVLAINPFDLPPGAPGPQGPQGPQGPRGPAGGVGGGSGGPRLPDTATDAGTNLVPWLLLIGAATVAGVGEVLARRRSRSGQDR
jgi:hypothetical protein